MDLDLDFDLLLSPGRRKEGLEVTISRELRPADLSLLAVNRGSTAPELKKLSERHHQLARCLASGMTVGEAAHTVGLNYGRVSMLKTSPAFVELVEHYKSVVDMQFADFAGQMAGLAKDAVLEIRERLEEEPEKFSNGMLLEVAKAFADRTGFGPSSKTEVTLNTQLGSRLDEARKRARAFALGDVIDAQVLGSDAA